MTNYQNYTLIKYLNALSLRSPVPGGGSAAALAAALGAALISMVANYSINPNQSQILRKKIMTVLRQSEILRKKFLELVDLDAQAYLQVVKTRHATAKEKKAALKEAKRIPQEVCRSVYKAIQLTPALVRYGNKNLFSDIEIAVELLLAAFKSAQVNVKINQ